MNDMVDTPHPHPAPVKKARSIWPWMILFAVLGGLGWFLWSAQSQTKGEANRRNAGAPSLVTVATVQKGDIDVVMNALGTVTPLATITVRPQIGGQIMQIAFTEGQMVQAGDFLAQIDPRPYETALSMAEGHLQRDQALLRDATINFERYQKLAAQEAVSKQQLTTQESLVEQYKGAVKTDQAEIDTAKLNLTYCKITAPVTGRIGLRAIDAGNYIQANGATSLTTITQMQPMSVLFSLPQDDVPAVQQEIQTGAVLDVKAFDRTQSAQLGLGMLTSMDNQIDTGTGTLKFRAQFENTDLALFPNQFVNVQVKVKTLKDAIIIPASGVQRGAQGLFVYKVADDLKVSLQPIKTAFQKEDRVAVAEGLVVGDRIVTDGTDRLREGASVTIADDK